MLPPLKSISIKLRPATIADCNNLFELEQQLFDYDSLSKRSFEHLLKSTRTAITTVAEYDDNIKAYVIFLLRKNSNTARLYSLGVHHEFRGQHIARLLIVNGINLLSSKSITKISLEVKTDNLHAIRLYENLGFIRVKTLRGYYDDGHDAFRYILDLKLPISSST